MRELFKRLKALGVSKIFAYEGLAENGQTERNVLFWPTDSREQDLPAELVSEAKAWALRELDRLSEEKDGLWYLELRVDLNREEVQALLVPYVRQKTTEREPLRLRLDFSTPLFLKERPPSREAWARGALEGGELFLTGPLLRFLESPEEFGEWTLKKTESSAVSAFYRTFGYGDDLTLERVELKALAFRARPVRPGSKEARVRGRADVELVYVRWGPLEADGASRETWTSPLEDYLRERALEDLGKV